MKNIRNFAKSDEIIKKQWYNKSEIVGAKRGLNENGKKDWTCHNNSNTSVIINY